VGNGSDDPHFRPESRTKLAPPQHNAPPSLSLHDSWPKPGRIQTFLQNVRGSITLGFVETSGIFERIVRVAVREPVAVVDSKAFFPFT
jgi:hypothetical protein